MPLLRFRFTMAPLQFSCKIESQNSKITEYFTKSFIRKYILLFPKIYCHWKRDIKPNQGTSLQPGSEREREKIQDSWLLKGLHLKRSSSHYSRPPHSTKTNPQRPVLRVIMGFSFKVCHYCPNHNVYFGNSIGIPFASACYNDNWRMIFVLHIYPLALHTLFLPALWLNCHFSICFKVPQPTTLDQC